MDRLAKERLAEPDCSVVIGTKVFFDGECEHESTRIVEFRNYRATSSDRAPFQWKDAGDRWNGGVGYSELTIEEVDRQQVFQTRFPISAYAIYPKAGKKSCRRI